MNIRSQPTIVTITTEAPARPQHQTIRYPEVRRRIATGRTYSTHGITYSEGAIITIRSDLAFTLEQAGILLPTDDAA